MNLNLGLKIGRSGGGRRSSDMILVYSIPSPLPFLPQSTNIELAIQANSGWFSAGQEVVINWGDGSAVETVSATSAHTGYIGHTYAAGTYTIKISGSMTMYGRSSDVSILGQTLLTRVDSFGKLGIASLAYAFQGCTGLTSVPKTLPDSVTNMSYMFRSCYGAAFNPNVSNWDVSKVTDMREMFRNCSGAAFNPNVSNWDVSKVENMSQMFYGCSGAAFNPNVSNWDVSKVTNMNSMFQNCSGAAFNPNVSNWDVSKVENMSSMFFNCSGGVFNPDVSNWDVSKVTDMSSMFRNCSGAAFNPNVSNWDVSKVTNMSQMFYGCSGAAFNPNVSNWDVSKVTNMNGMFRNCSHQNFRGGRGVDGLGIANWIPKSLLTGTSIGLSNFMLSAKAQDATYLDSILNAWAALIGDPVNPLPTKITCHFGTTKYTSAGAASYAKLTVGTNFGGALWTITSGGRQA